uniref:ATP synthase F0 subunit 8 n=1 Tax=Eochionelasmus coreana TaxID=2764602 RepID=A0A7G7YI75_9CRUS|nr:ATP synthase F0 subunit 8 [Eochionelasmus coreana]
MPHMSPILWSVILAMSFSLMMMMLAMMYFNSSPLIPCHETKKLSSPTNKWPW